MKEEEKKIICLGKEFNSEDERREYFRNELRKKLPELKKMEGFPIGKDDDIINLSDPPYYTACPNPWLKEFIREWEISKLYLEKKGFRKNDIQVNEPFTSDISEGKGSPVYNAHSYHTKVPHLAIVRYILHYTQPGDIIYDGFSGTGMTGLASSLLSALDAETEYKIKLEWSKNYNLEPISKTRKTIVSDLSPIATFISYNYNTPVDRIRFQKEMDEIYKAVYSETNWMYQTKHSNGDLGVIKHIVWSEVFICNNCNEDIIFWSAAIDSVKGQVLDEFSCPSCSTITNKRNLERSWTTTFDELTNDISKLVKQVPVLISYTYQGKNYEKKPDQYDFEIIQKIESTKILNWVPIFEIESGDKTIEAIRKGSTHVHLLYTKRNLIELSLLYSMLDLRGKFLFTSLLTRSSRQGRFLVKNFFHGGGGWVGTNLSGTLFLPSLSVEVRPLFTFQNRIDKIFSWNILNNRDTLVSTNPAQISTLSDNSIDYIFTDPPFGSNIMYSELNTMNEAWLGVLTNNKPEAIENKSQGKSSLSYQTLMSECFRDYYRVLKPGKWMTVEFSNTSAAIWNGIQTAIQAAGFIISNVSSLDKKQGSFNAVTNPTSVKQDLIISCYKPSSEFDQKFKQHQNTDVAVWDFLVEHLNHLPIHLVKENATSALIERSPKILFDRLIAFYLQRGLPVPIDAGKFQLGLKEHFIERDGMFFTNEQVEEYDQKKKDNPEFIQLSLLVSSEQDGVLWLKNLLSEKSKSYQDIQPLWMQALAGVRKGDIIPELADILEENFLKDSNGKWYVANPENETDLEKLRNKRLLKQFETYKEEAAKPKGKIKEARVEALRVGFKHCYQEKDFKTIVQIGDRIPNNLLMEDEVLLQFYDIAISRV
jgi:DNA modification methylase